MKLFFREEGAGFPLIIIHGLYGSSDNWLTVAKKLSVKYRVYLIDQRNHGRSPSSEIHSYEAMKNDLAEFFEDRQLERAVVMGHSMGGKTAMWFAAEYPEKVEKLVVADIAPKDYFRLDDESQYYLHKSILEAMRELDLSTAESRKDIEEFLNLKIDSVPVVQFLLKSVQRSKLHPGFEWRLNVNALYDNLDEIISGVNAHWFEDRRPILNYPVLFIKGANSAYIQSDDVPQIKQIYPEAQIRVIPDAGHWLHAEQPQLFMEALWSFL